MNNQQATVISAAHADTLIVVACHGIYLGGSSDGSEGSEWLIEPFQAGETTTFVEHIRRGVEKLAKASGRGMLVFSGGATKKLKTKGEVSRTEAEGYMDIAIRRDLFGLDTNTKKTRESLQHRIFEENYATDSYQNILLSLIQYSVWLRQLQQRLGGYEPTAGGSIGLILPKKLIIVSHEFKRARFLDLHLPAIRCIWPSDVALEVMEVEYIGVNPPFDEQKLREIEEGDRKRGYGAWKEDMLGCGELLSAKRRDRGWDESAFMEYMKQYMEPSMIKVVEGLVSGSR